MLVLFPGGPHWLEVQWAGAVVDFFLAPLAGEWVVRNYSLMATSNLTRLMLGSDPNNFTDGGPVVDAVVVVPEPASLAALLAGLGMLAFRRRTSLRSC